MDKQSWDKEERKKKCFYRLDYNKKNIGHHIKYLKNLYIHKVIISFAKAAELSHCLLSPPIGRLQSPLTLHQVPNSPKFSWAILGYNPVSHVSQWSTANVCASPSGSARRQPPIQTCLLQWRVTAWCCVHGIKFHRFHSTLSLKVLDVRVSLCPGIFLFPTTN